MTKYNGEFSLETHTACEFDFDGWVQLASEDPEAFEQRRRQEISQLISSAPEDSRMRLERLQFRIDGIRRQSGSHLGGCVAISELMWEKLAGQGGLLESLERLQGLCGGIPAGEDAATADKPRATVLSFPSVVPKGPQSD